MNLTLEVYNYHMYHEKPQCKFSSIVTHGVSRKVQSALFLWFLGCFDVGSMESANSPVQMGVNNSGFFASIHFVSLRPCCLRRPLFSVFIKLSKLRLQCLFIWVLCHCEKRINILRAPSSSRRAQKGATSIPLLDNCPVSHLPALTFYLLHLHLLLHLLQVLLQPTRLLPDDRAEQVVSIPEINMHDF